MRQTSAVAKKGATCLVLSFQDILYSLQVQIRVKRFNIPYCPNKHHQRCVLTSTVAPADTQSTMTHLWLRPVASLFGKKVRINESGTSHLSVRKTIKGKITAVSGRLSQQTGEFRTRAGMLREKQESLQRSRVLLGGGRSHQIPAAAAKVLEN